jgi:hypothetical protein
MYHENFIDSSAHEGVASECSDLIFYIFRNILFEKYIYFVSFLIMMSILVILDYFGLFLFIEWTHVIIGYIM